MLQIDEIPDDVLEKIKESGAERLYLQAPEGLKHKIQGIADMVENLGFETVIHADQTYGACDIPDHDARLFDCDAILHIGHEPFGVRSDMDVIYWNVVDDADLVEPVKGVMDDLPKSLGIVSTIQHKHKLGEVKEFLEDNNFEVENCSNVLGCRHNVAMAREEYVDAYLFIGSGNFHPLGLALATEKTVYALDIERGEIRSMDDEKKRVLKLKAAAKLEYDRAKNVGIVLTTKRGQLMTHLDPFKVRDFMKEDGKNVWLFSMDHVDPAKLEGVKVDIYVNCACPRLVEDTFFKKPLINPEDIMNPDQKGFILRAPSK